MLSKNLILSEIYLNSQLNLHDGNLSIPRYDLTCANLSKTKREEVWTYYKESLQLELCNIHFFKEHICFETSFWNSASYPFSNRLAKLVMNLRTSSLT